MNREIKFRGQKQDNKEWVYGYYLSDIATTLIPYAIYANQKFHKVIPESIGQFTGLHDKKGKEIYEGDILHDIGGKTWIVKWNHSGWYKWVSNPNEEGGVMFHIHEQFNNYNIIGNIYQTPELLNQ